MSQIWRNNLIVLVVLISIGTGWGLSGNGIRFVVGIICATVAFVLVLLCVVLSVGIRRGQQNVHRIQKAADATEHTEGAAQ